MYLGDSQWILRSILYCRWFSHVYVYNFMIVKLWIQWSWIQYLTLCFSLTRGGRVIFSFIFSFQFISFDGKEKNFIQRMFINICTHLHQPIHIYKDLGLLPICWLYGGAIITYMEVPYCFSIMGLVLNQEFKIIALFFSFLALLAIKMNYDIMSKKATKSFQKPLKVVNKLNWWKQMSNSENWKKKFLELSTFEISMIMPCCRFLV